MDKEPPSLPQLESNCPSEFIIRAVKTTIVIAVIATSLVRLFFWIIFVDELVIYVLWHLKLDYRITKSLLYLACSQYSICLNRLHNCKNKCTL